MLNFSLKEIVMAIELGSRVSGDVQPPKNNTVIACKMFLEIAVTVAFLAGAIILSLVAVHLFASIPIWEEGIIIGLATILGAVGLATPFVAYHHEMHRDTGHNLVDAGNFLKKTVILVAQASYRVLIALCFLGLVLAMYHIAYYGLTVHHTVVIPHHR